MLTTDDVVEHIDLALDEGNIDAALRLLRDCEAMFDVDERSRLYRRIHHFPVTAPAR